MKKFLFLLLLFVLPFSYGEWYTDSEQVEVSVLITGSYDLERGAGSSLSHVVANLSFVPYTNNRQKPITLQTVPPSEDIAETISFTWDSPSANSYEFQVKSNVLLEHSLTKITEKVPFPIQNVPEEHKKYTLPSDTIDSENPDIIKLANELAAGEDDLFKVVHNMAEWTKSNIRYNLSTLTVSASEPASWVLENRRGVCDELTNLFVALLRSLGIPAKFVSGIAYTDSELFDENWGAHGWAEVYFPGYGWVDYDVTYGEFGYVDPTHIKLKEGIDALEASTRYSWYGRNAQIFPGNLDIQTVLNDFSGKVDHGIDLSLQVEKPIVGFGSYNIITATVTNNNPYYVSEEFFLFTTEETTIHGDPNKYVFLEPKSEEQLYWVINVDTLDPGFVYTFPLTTRSFRNITKDTTFIVERNGIVMTKEEAERSISLKETREQKEYSEQLYLYCDTQDSFYSFETATVSCILANEGNVYLEGIKVCLENDCTTLDVGISREEQITFTLEDKNIGKKEKTIVAETTNAIASSIIGYDVLDKPKIAINELAHPPNVAFEEDYVIEFLLEKESFANANNVLITLSHEGVENSWQLPELSEKRGFQVDLNGKNMILGANTYLIDVTYEDTNGEIFAEQQEFTIELVDLNFSQKVLALMNLLIRRFLTTRGFIEFVSVVTIAFVLIFFYIYRRHSTKYIK